MNNQRVLEILHDAKALAREYYQLTGKPLGVTGEVAEYEAARLLGVELGPARQAGYDAVEQRNGATRRLQIKGRCLWRGVMASLFGSTDQAADGMYSASSAPRANASTRANSPFTEGLAFADQARAGITMIPSFRGTVSCPTF